MGNTQTKKEQIIVEAAGVGQNNGKQSATDIQPLNRTEWMLIGFFLTLVGLFFIKSYIKQRKKFERTRRQRDQLQMMTSEIMSDI